MWGTNAKRRPAAVRGRVECRSRDQGPGQDKTPSAEADGGGAPKRAPGRKMILMSQQDDFERILASLYEATLDDLHWDKTSALIDEACGARGNSVVFAGMTPAGAAEILFARICHRGQRDREFEQEYVRVHYPVDERLPRFRQLPDSKIVHVTELLSEQELKKSRLYNEILPRRQSQDSLYTRMDGPFGSRIGWVIGDPVDARGWSSAQIDMIRRLLPHLRQFVRVRHALVECGALGAPLGELVENSLAGVIKLDRHGRIVATNDRALELLRDGDVLSDEDGTLSASSLEDNPELQRLLARALPPFGDQGESGSMVVKHSSGPPAMVLHVIPVEDPQVDFRTWRTAALVLAVEPRRQTRIDRHVLRATLGLTPAESEVAALLAEGLSVRGIVEAKGRGEYTVREQVKQIFRKLRVSRQMDLVQIVRATGGFLPPGRRDD